MLPVMEGGKERMTVLDELEELKKVKNMTVLKWGELAPKCPYRANEKGDKQDCSISPQGLRECSFTLCPFT